jgi:hypothetical protein
MKLTVLVSPTPNGRAFRAKSGKPHQLAVEATDPETAYSALAELLRTRAAGVELHRIDAERYHPMFESFGTIDPNAPSTMQFEEDLQEYRRQRDEEEDEAIPLPAGGAA